MALRPLDYVQRAAALGLAGLAVYGTAVLVAYEAVRALRLPLGPRRRSNSRLVRAPRSKRRGSTP